jgi:cobalt-zinc-cadmium efflux system protein
MSHNHDHHHPSVSVNEATSKALVFGIGLNFAYVVVELIAGFSNHSLALITDAGHNFGDVISLALSLLAFYLAKMKPNAVYTYGYKKTTILAALVNAAILLIAIGILGFESVSRLRQPEPVQGGTIAVIAAIGILINVSSALFFLKTQKSELNARGAYLHMMTDALVSVGVVIAGVLIRFTGWYWLDPAISLIVLIVILFGTWSLLRESLRLSLDAVPPDMEVGEIQKAIAGMQGVRDVHHIHIWAMSTTENALTAHIVFENDLSDQQKLVLVKEIKHELFHRNIQHSTLEAETDDSCTELVCKEGHG